MRYGFINKNGRSEVPLDKIQVYSYLKGFTAEVVANMEYKNNSDSPIEAIYVFPLDEEAAVCGFQATIDGRTIVAEIQGKDEARDTYDDAISSGRSAFLLEESDESSDIFQINVGNLPPHQSASVQLTFITTLKVEQEGRVVFILPTVLNPRYSPSDCSASVSATMDSLSSVSSKYSFDFDMNVECSSAIQEITSPRHQLKVTINQSDSRRAFIHLDKDSYKFDGDLEVQVLCSHPFEPHALMENGSTDDEFMSKSVVMVNLFPKFDSSASLERGEFIFVVDRSGSMGGSNIKSARETLLLFLKSLPEDCYFNVVGFGSSFAKLFGKSKRYDDNSLKEACVHAESMEANLGGTEILAPLREVFSWPSIKDYPRQVFILTDGDVGNTQQVIDLVKCNSSKARCFAFGIGAGASTALVKGVARAGKGVAEFVAVGEKMKAKVIKVLKNALQPVLLDCKVDWDLPRGCSAESIPQVPPPIFSGNSLIIYGLVSCDSNIQGSINVSGSLAVGSAVEKIQHKVSLDSLVSADNSFLLHRLAAKTLIQEKQDADSDTLKENIVKISKSANVVSKLTSFVAVDKETKQQVTAPLVGPRLHRDEFLAFGLYRVPPQSYGSGLSFDDCSRRGDVMTLQGNALPRKPARTRRSKAMKTSIFSGSPFSGLSKLGGKTSKSEHSFRTSPVMKSKITMGNTEIEDKYDYSSSDESEEISSQAAPCALNLDCLELVSLQKASGAWELSAELASILGTPLDNLKQTCPSQITTEDKDSIWATALALTCLNVTFSHQKDEWEIIAAKGTNWLKKNLPKDVLSYDMIMGLGASVLGV